MTVLNTKIKPLGVTPGVGVDPQEKIVLHGLDLDDAIQVAGLEAAVEDELVGQVECGVHTFEGPVEDGGPIVMIIL